MKKLFAVSRKDLKLLYRDKGGFFFTFIFPILMAVFFGSMMSTSSGMKGIGLLVVDQDQTTVSSEFIAKLDAADEVRVTHVEEDFARNQVRKGKSSAFLILPEGFGDAKSNMFSGNTAKVQLGVDPKRTAIAGLLQGVLMRYAAEDMQDMFSDTSMMTSQIDKSLLDIQESRDKGEFSDDAQAERLSLFLTDLQDMIATDGFGTTGASGNGEAGEEGEGGFNGFQPLVIETVDVVTQRDGPTSGYEISFPQGIMWGIMGCLATFALSLITERNQGTLSRLLLSDASRGTILAGKALACFITILFIAIGLLVLGKLLFGLTVRQPLHMALSLVAIGVCFSGLMMMFSVVSKSEKAASGITWAVMMIMAMSGGGMIPLAFLPEWMSTVSQFSPIKWSILALEGPIWRQFSLPELMPALLVLLAIGTAGFVVGVRLFKWQSATT
jgi:ABC-2 type transport system permease protein